MRHSRTQNRRGGGFFTLRSAARRRKALPGLASLRALLPYVLAPALLVALPLLGFALTKTFYFARNPRFTLRQVTIQTGDTLSEADLREVIGIEPGVNLFAIDIAQERRKFLDHAHHVRNIQMTRVLPDRLEIRVIERRPVARVGRAGDLVADPEGLVFVWRGDVERLPMLVGGRHARGGGILVVGETLVEVYPGARVYGNAQAGIEALLLNEEPPYQLPVMEVDVSRLDHIVLHLDDRREIRLAWDGMGQGTRDAARNLRRRMNALMDVLRNPDAAGKRQFDARVDDRHIIGR